VSKLTYHLVAAEYYRDSNRNADYTPEAFADEGFIHTTNALEHVATVANRYYKGDRRMYVMLVIDMSKVRDSITTEDPERVYPHIQGPLNRDAIISIVPVLREADGSFNAPKYP
jgi:uncharacterized protein (DUF952 family)